MRSVRIQKTELHSLLLFMFSKYFLKDLWWYVLMTRKVSCMCSWWHRKFDLKSSPQELKLSSNTNASSLHYSMHHNLHFTLTHGCRSILRHIEKWQAEVLRAIFSLIFQSSFMFQLLDSVWMNLCKFKLRNN